MKNEEEGYLLEALGRISRRLPAKHVLYVVDACYSGYAIYKPRSIF